MHDRWLTTMYYIVQDVNNVTFEVKNGDQAEDQSRLDEILEVNDQKQILQFFLEEDARDEDRWADRLASLKPDSP